MIVAAYAIAAVAAPLARVVWKPRLPRAAGPMGLGLEAAGLALRALSMRTLGRSYSRTLRVELAQRTVESGPYRFVRHPGYAGSLLIWTGFALTSRSLPVVEGVGGLLALAYHRRVAAEEVLLRRELPGYAAYSRRTKRLIPFVW
jgi:protein-S-isoprenylcysteine O-methyltransferase